MRNQAPAGARLDGVQQAYNRINTALESPLSSKDPVNG